MFQKKCQKKMFFSVLTVLWLAPAAAWAQAAMPGGAPGRQPPENQAKGGPPAAGDAGNLDNLKTQLRASDEEWKVIGPKLLKVLSASRIASTGLNATWAAGPMGMPGFGGPGDRNRGGRPGGPGGKDSFDGPGDAASGGRGPGGPRPGNFGPPPNGFGPPGQPPEGFGPPPGGGFGPPGAPGQGDANASKSGTTDATKAGAADANRPRQGGPPPGGGFGPPGFGDRNNAVSQALADLQTAVKDNASPDVMKKKTAAVRTARHKARTALETAKKDLLRVLTADQEAVLVSLGYIE